jgi:hypothetical protein
LLQTVCGPQAFEGDSYNSGNPLFKRTDGYISGWITSDPSDIRLPNGSTRAIRTRYTLIVEDLPAVQIQNVSISDDHANIWGCWYRTDLTSQVKTDAEAEYVKMQQGAPAVPVKLYHIMSNGTLEEIPASSQPVDVTVPSYSNDGVKWCTATAGRHEIRFKTGAYSPWPTNTGCDPKGCWKGTVYVYKNADTDAIFAGGAKGEPQKPLLRIGWGEWKMTIAESEMASQTLEADYIELQKNDCLTFIAVDERQAYNFPASNRGQVVISIVTP